MKDQPSASKVDFKGYPGGPY